MTIKDLVKTYVDAHGKDPAEIVVTPHALLALAAGSSATEFSTLPVRIAVIDGNDAVQPGTGTRLGIFVKDSGIQHHLAAVDLK